jgi:hypothetical protein
MEEVMCPVYYTPSGQRARTAMVSREARMLALVSGLLLQAGAILHRVAAIRVRTPALLTLFLLGACMSPGAPHGVPGDGVSPRRAPCILAIENHNWHDVHVYAVSESGERVRLATVSSLDERRIRIPETLMLGQRIRLIAVPPLSREALITEFVMPDDGRTFHWTLRNHLALSTLVVR